MKITIFRAPFAGDKDYMDCKTQMLQLAFEMATNAHRDIFSEKPVVTIRRICEKLTKMADHIIQVSIYRFFNLFR